MLFSENEFQVWPVSSFKLVDFLKPKVIFAKSNLVNKIEGFFRDLYPGIDVVLMPSGRSCLLAVIQYLELRRNDHIFIPPYSSHCVINALGYAATPSPTVSEKIKAELVFHQWGFVQKSNVKGIIIEDSVDSLIPKGGALFPNDGRFEILSLSKIFGCLTGGIILCQHTEDAEKIRQLRDARPKLGMLHFWRRISGQKSPQSYNCWNAVEPTNGDLLRAALADIWSHISFYDAIVEDRRKKINYLKSVLPHPAVSLPEGRLVTCWPISIKNKPSWLNLPDHIIRHLQNPSKSYEFLKVYPLPIHQGMNITRLYSVFGAL
jgi:putative PLP-dependent aminotransferase (TIGR04422 family)